MRLPQNLFDGDVSIQVILCQPDKTRIGEILPYDKKGTLKFNSYSEISLTIDRYYNDLLTGETKVNPYYDFLESPRIIELRGIGHFVIQDGDENIGDSESKSITAFSLEHSTGQKYLENFYVNTGEEGSVETMYHARTHGAEYAIDVYYEKATTWDKFERYYKKEYTKTNAYNYVEVQVFDENDFAKYKGENSENTLYVKAYPNVRFYWPTKPELSLLHLVIAHIPEWKIGHVDKELWYEERTFSEDRMAVYDFLYNTAAPTFKFVMVWDTVGDENTVSFYKAEEDGITTELIPTYYYNENFIYHDKDGNIVTPKFNEDGSFNGNYYIKYDAIETQWDTDVFISKDNLASEIDISYSADDIKTKLKITGADTLDVRDINLGQNYVLNLSYYNDDLWMGKDLHAKYDQYTKYLAEKTDEYSNLISKWSAAYNEYSDLMNNVPVEPRVLLVGDIFDKLYCIYNKTSDSTLSDGVLLEELKEKLALYRVGVDDNGNISKIDKTDDVLLTLENDANDSVTIRVKCIKAPTIVKDNETVTYYKNSDYKVYCTKTTASSGLSLTSEYNLTQWIDGIITAEELKLYHTTDAGEKVFDFKVKSIGTLGAYLCIARDETIKANVEDYGIRLLQEKQDVYTKIFITQTEGYMSQEGSRCVAQATKPTGGNVGDKWLDTGSKNACIWICTEIDVNGNMIWEEYSVNKIDDDNNLVDNSAEFENYTRFLDNYKKLQVVQEVLSEKQRVANYLLNGVGIDELYFTSENLNLTNLLCAAIFHHLVSNNYYMVSVSEPINPIDNMIWIQRGDDLPNVKVYQYSKTAEKWSFIGNDFGSFNSVLTDVFIDVEKKYGYLTYIYNPEYQLAEKYSDEYTYFVMNDNDSFSKFYAQPSNDSDVLHTYTGNIADGVTIVKDTVCYFTIGDIQYKFTAPYDLNKSSILLCNPDTNKLIVGITTSELEVSEDKSMSDTTNLSFAKVDYWIAEGLEYAVYTTNGMPYISYSHSQGMCLAQMNYIKELTDMNNYFSEAERMRLSPFIREDEYSDDNFLLTGYESEAEQMDIKKSLLKAGTEELAKICKPRLSFDATMANLLAIPEFAPLRWQFKLGNFVSVGLREPYNISANVKKARLLEVNINFEDASDFSCTFGDLESTKSLVDKHADLLSQAVTVAKQVATHSSNWQKGANKATALDDAINDGLRDAALSIGAADGQAITWDKYGIRGRKLIDGTTDQYHDEQFALINNKLAFTTDNWKTSKAVVGEFEVEIDKQKQSMYGLLADAVVGGYIQGATIKGGELEIGGEGGVFRVNKDGSVQILTTDEQPIYATKSEVNMIEYATKYRVELSYGDSTIFNAVGQTCQVTCKVWKETEEITSMITAFNWYINGELYKTTTAPNITITNDSFTGSMQLNCQVTFNE